ncbi:WD40-repeat-containing domain protein [Jimgerdemannia flammicorona]|uniref:WD40-repeat-containing domain protein n=1 Tax=Jimgerdemannia flammicorona TaxID=994334 RepID=A0A433PHP4_9FUNG|nr:WD40-repeat-containing domain protein [Jimgerdemannia flammicorona]
MTLSLLSLPWDLLRSILPHLTLTDLHALLLTNTTLHELVQREGWRSLCRTQGWDPEQVLVDTRHSTPPSPSPFSDGNDINTTDWARVARMAHNVQCRWTKRQFTIASIQRHFFMPTVRFNRRVLAFTVGHKLDIYHDWSVTGKRFHAQHHVEFDAHDGDVTDVLLTQGDMGHQSIWTCSIDSLIKRWDIPTPGSAPTQPTQTLQGHLSAVHSIHAHSANPTTLASLGNDETLRLWDTATATAQYTLPLSRRLWVARFTTATQLAIGARGVSALSLYAVLPTGPEHVVDLPVGAFAVYGLHPHAVTDHTLAAGCYDGIVRLFDLRTHRVVSTFQDPYDDSPVYDVTADHFHVAAGTANHGIVRVWDARYAPTVGMGAMKRGDVHDGWSVYLGEVRSPVYSVQMDFGRLVGATSSETSVLDFTAAAGIEPAKARFRGRGDQAELERSRISVHVRNQRQHHPVNRGRSTRQQLSRLSGKRIFYSHSDFSTYIGE